MPLEAVTHRIVGVLEKFGIPYAITGGVATGMYGVPRDTQDVDVIIPLDVKKAKELIKELRAAKFRFIKGLGALREGGILTMSSPEGYYVDLFVRESLPELERVYEEDYFGKKINFIALEDLIEWKLSLRRADDLLDVIDLIRLNEDTVDWGYLDGKLTGENRSLLEELRKVARGEKEVTGVFEWRRY